MFSINMKLGGLTCVACKKVAEKRIATINGVKNVVVDLESGATVIKADRNIAKEDVENVLADTDYKVIS